MSADILPTYTPKLFEHAVEVAVGLLKAGRVVALPTETVYGLAANALDADAVTRIFAIKGRPPSNPIIVHVSSPSMARDCAASWPRLADRLGDAFWPGPLTLVVPKSPGIPDIVSAGGSTVGVRWPQHPFMQAVIRACGFPLAAPSANLSNRLSPTTAQHVASQLGDQIPLIVDGGDCNVGIESTVVDVTGSSPRILRPGMISSDAILATCSCGDADAVRDSSSVAGPLRSPGLLEKHYSPRAKLRTLKWRDEASLLAALQSAGIPPHRAFVLAHSHIPLGDHFQQVNVIPHDPEAFARGLYAELHRCDESGAEWVIVEAPPDSSDWAGIADRLHRASAS